MGHLGMVLEGGGLRGIYTAGVLDCLLDHQLHDCAGIVAVSAGATHAASYIARQRGRSLRVNTDYLTDKRYISLWSWLTTGNMVGAEFVYHTIPNVLDHFDYAGYKNSPTKLYVTVSNLDTGQAEHIWIPDLQKGMDYLRASASLPLFSRTVKINSQKYLDGGVCDSIPIEAALGFGFSKCLVVLTQPEGFAKTTGAERKWLRVWYRRYPRFVEAALNRHLNYNQSLNVVKQLEYAGQALVLRPTQPLDIQRLEKNAEKILDGYRLGYQDTLEKLDQLKEFWSWG